MGDGGNKLAELEAKYDDLMRNYEEAVKRAHELEARSNELLRRAHELETTCGQQLRMIDYYKNKMSVAEANLEAAIGRRELIKGILK